MCNTPHSLFGFPDKGNQSIDVALRFLLLYRPVIPLPPPLPQSASPTDFPSSPSTSPHPFLFLPCLPFSSRSLSSLALLLPFHFQIHLKSAFLSRPSRVHFLAPTPPPPLSPFPPAYRSSRSLPPTSSAPSRMPSTRSSRPLTLCACLLVSHVRFVSLRG